MELVVKTFQELTVDEFHDIIRAREEIFIVEQDCVYLDVDGTDKVATHLFWKEGGEILSYARLYWEESRDSCVKVGRVIAPRRGCGCGRMIMESAVQIGIERYQPKELYLHAQEYAIGFYEKSGFSVISEPYLEDGIFHVDMLLTVGEKVEVGE